jgi:MATE family multidrug resistance protein
LSAGRYALQAEVLRLALPAVGDQLITLCAAVVSVGLAGHLGAAPLAALGFSNQIVLLSLVLLTPLAVGGGVLVAQAIGAGNLVAAHQVLGQALYMAVATGVFLMVAGLAMAAPALRLLGAEADALRLGVPLLRLFSVSLPFQSLVYVVASCLRGAGDTRTPMWVLAVSAGVQVLSSVLLANGLLGFPDLGILGVGVGLLVGQVVGTVLLLGALAGDNLSLSLKKTPWSLSRPIMRSILNVGSPAGGEQLSLRLGQMANARIVASLGTVAFAANVVAFNAMALALAVGVGFTVAATTMVGQRVGAGDPRAARTSAGCVWGMAAAGMGLMGLVLLLGGRPVLSFLTGDQQVIWLAVLPLQIAALVLPVEATNQVLGGAMRGAGDTRWPMITTTWGNWLVRIPLAIVLIGWLGLAGVWLASAAEIVLRAIANALRFRTDAWLKESRMKQEGAVV